MQKNTEKMLALEQSIYMVIAVLKGKLNKIQTPGSCIPSGCSVHKAKPVKASRVDRFASGMKRQFKLLEQLRAG